MNGIVYLNDSKEIIAIVPDVESHTDIDIIGKDASVKGIDLTQASFCLVESTDLGVGDTIDPMAIVDSRGSLPETPEQTIYRQASLITELQSRVAQNQDDNLFIMETLVDKGLM